MFNANGPRPKEGEAGTTEAVVLPQSTFAQQSGAEQSKGWRWPLLANCLFFLPAPTLLANSCIAKWQHDSSPTKRRSKPWQPTEFRSSGLWQLKRQANVAPAAKNDDQLKSAKRLCLPSHEVDGGANWVTASAAVNASLPWSEIQAGTPISQLRLE